MTILRVLFSFLLLFFLSFRTVLSHDSPHSERLASPKLRPTTLNNRTNKAMMLCQTCTTKRDCSTNLCANGYCVNRVSQLKSCKRRKPATPKSEKNNAKRKDKQRKKREMKNAKKQRKMKQRARKPMKKKEKKSNQNTTQGGVVTCTPCNSKVPCKIGKCIYNRCALNLQARQECGIKPSGWVQNPTALPSRVLGVRPCDPCDATIPCRGTLQCLHGRCAQKLTQRIQCGQRQPHQERLIEEQSRQTGGKMNCTKCLRNAECASGKCTGGICTGDEGPGSCISEGRPPLQAATNSKKSEKNSSRDNEPRDPEDYEAEGYEKEPEFEIEHNVVDSHVREFDFEGEDDPEEVNKAPEIDMHQFGSASK